MHLNETRLDTVRAAVLDRIRDRFEGNDEDDELLLSCPLGSERIYAISPEDGGTWYVAFDDDDIDSSDEFANLATVEQGMEAIAEDIARRIVEAEAVLRAARETRLIGGETP